MQLFKRSVSPRGLTAFAFEIVLVFGSLVLAVRLNGSDDLPAVVWKLVVITAVCQLCFYYVDLYDFTAVHSWRETVVRLLVASGAAALLLAAGSLVVPWLLLGNGIVVSSLLFIPIAMVAWRLIFVRLGQSAQLQERLLIVGTGPGARRVARLILDQHDYPYRIVGFIDEDPAMVGRSVVNPRVLGTPADIERIVREHHVGPDRRGLDRTAAAGCRSTNCCTRSCRACAWRIRDDDVRAADRQDPARRPQAELADLLRRIPRLARLTRAVKRASTSRSRWSASSLASPLMLLTALAVRLESPGPVLYAQERVGEHGRVFTLLQVPLDADGRRAGDADLGDATATIG